MGGSPIKPADIRLQSGVVDMLGYLKKKPGGRKNYPLLIEVYSSRVALINPLAADLVGEKCNKKMILAFIFKTLVRVSLGWAALGGWPASFFNGGSN